MEETMMYCLPRFMNLGWNYLQKANIVDKRFEIPLFLNAVFGLSVGSMTHFYMRERDLVKRKYHFIGEKIIGDAAAVKPKENSKAETPKLDSAQPIAV
jgi:hypothetical protein